MNFSTCFTPERSKSSSICAKTKTIKEVHILLIHSFRSYFLKSLSTSVAITVADQKWLPYISDQNGQFVDTVFLLFRLSHTEYLTHAPCMRNVQTGYERCAVEYQSHVREHSGNANGALGSNAVDDPIENSKKLCWYGKKSLTYILTCSRNVQQPKICSCMFIISVRSRTTWSVPNRSFRERAAVKQVRHIAPLYSIRLMMIHQHAISC